MALIVAVDHPEHLYGMLRVDHPTLDPLTQGAADLGWEGDPRLVVYLNQLTDRFFLYRLEDDNQYRGVAQLPAGGEITPANVNQLCRMLVRTDQRRGFDPVADIVAAQDAYQRKAAADRQAFIEGWADKFHYTLARSHLPGIDISRPRLTTSRR